MMMRTIKINYLTLLKTKLNKYIIYCGTCNVKYQIDIYCVKNKLCFLIGY